MDGVTNKGAIIVAIIGAVATIISACISVSLQRENVVLVENNADLENRLYRLEQSRDTSVDKSISEYQEVIQSYQSTIESYKNEIDSLHSEIDRLKNQPYNTFTFGSSNFESDTTRTTNASNGFAVYSLLPGGDYQNSGLLVRNSGYKDFGTVTDNYGNLHEHALSNKNWSSSYDNVYMEINLDWQYARLTGVFFQNGYYASSPETTKLRIMERLTNGSDIILWEGEVTGSTEPLTFDINVSEKGKIGFHLIQKVRTQEQPAAFFEAHFWK